MKRGFTLIEIIVALGIFSIVAVVALAALVKIVDANKKAQTTQDAVVGLSFALEAMSRELRTATNIHCEAVSTGSVSNPTTFTDQSCASGGGHNQLIVFRSANTDNTVTPPCRLVYAYLISSTGSGYQISKAHQTPGSHCSQQFTSADFADASILPTSVTLTDYQMIVQSNPPTSPFPIVFISLSGYSGARETVKTYFNVQTAVSQRAL